MPSPLEIHSIELRKSMRVNLRRKVRKLVGKGLWFCDLFFFLLIQILIVVV